MPSATTTNVTAEEHSPNLTLPRSVVAAVSPHPYLLAHLDPSDPALDPARPSGRGITDFRSPKCQTGSLTHCAGSAVVRLGDTAVVCGIHAEILLASSTPDPPSPSSTRSDDELMAQLQLLVPNVELSTGCSPAHLPGAGGPPSTMAQTLAHKLHLLLHSARVINLEDLRIRKFHTDMSLSNTAETESTDLETVAYWTLYASIYVLSLSGNSSLFDVSWAALLSALADTRLPHAWWDLDAENVVCSPDLQSARRLSLRSRPIACTWGVFAGAKKQETKAQPLENKRNLIHGDSRSISQEAQAWLLADPDGFEDPLCYESITVVVDCSSGLDQTEVVAIEKCGGEILTFNDLFELQGVATQRWKVWVEVLFPV